MKFLGEPVTVQRIRRAYASCGMNPTACIWFDEEAGDCCPVSAMLLVAGMESIVREAQSVDLIDSVSLVCEATDVNPRTLRQFIAGVDGAYSSRDTVRGLGAAVRRELQI